MPAMHGFIDPLIGRSFAGRRVLITGHTGFKGGWLSAWLLHLGADVVGLSLPPYEGPGVFKSCDLDSRMDSRFADIRNPAALQEALQGVDAEIVFHLAAQPLVRHSYRFPAETFATNVSGTANVLDAVRQMPSLRAVVVITSDKCYDNREWTWGYREIDPLGGHDPYSASKGCTELVAQAYRHAFFADSAGPQLATARAGNVIGGGDWGEERLVPDIVRAASSGVPLEIRSPKAVRPWQHVLEPLSGYLQLGARLLEDGAEFAGAWNFGPDIESTVNVRELMQLMRTAWGQGAPEVRFAEQQPETTATLHEAGLLRLDSTKARTHLGWRPQLGLAEAIGMTVDWYKAHALGEDMGECTEQQISGYGALMAGSSLTRYAMVAE
jgi:CDP-glucose 4,6-dehydratase